MDCTKYTCRSVSPPDLVSRTSESSITGVSTGRKPNCSNVWRIVSSMRWKAIWSRGSSSMTPDGVRGLIGVLKVRGSRVENRRRMYESVRPAAGRIV